MFILDRENSIANQYLTELRDVKTQQDRLRFRKNLFRLGEIMAYEISRVLRYQSHSTKTSLGTYQKDVPVAYPVLVTILRAGLPLAHQSYALIFVRAQHARLCCIFVPAVVRPAVTRQ